MVSQVKKPSIVISINVLLFHTLIVGLSGLILSFTKSNPFIDESN